MSVFEAVIWSVVIVWTPGMAFAAYLLVPRRRNRLDQLRRQPYE